jgi:hypothetical protein
LHNLGPESATARELDPEMAYWSSQAKTNAILADIFDMLAQINANLVAVGSHKASKKTKPYPRPGDKDKQDKKLGKNALPAEELDSWFAKKRKAYKDRHK